MKGLTEHELTFTKDEVKAIILDSFVRGKNRGSSKEWDALSFEQKASMSEEDCDAIYNGAMLDKIFKQN